MYLFRQDGMVDGMVEVGKWQAWGEAVFDIFDGICGSMNGLDIYGICGYIYHGLYGVGNVLKNHI